ncbi:MAG: primosomal protein N' [Gemmatimonadetes bacterium]|nr:primosomal protein N' [Gemmatimonadota bacterium]
MPGRFAQVALPLPIAAPYSYAVPDDLADRIVPGSRVVVQVRRQELVGVVMAVDDSAPAHPAKPVLAVPDPVPVLSPALLKTAHWLANYYGAPLGIVLKAMLPGPLWGESEVRLALQAGRPVGGGTAGELARWLERRGGEATIREAARALKRPLWAAADRLSRVGALTMTVEPPRTSAGRSVAKGVELVGPRLTLLQRNERFRTTPKQLAVYQALEGANGPVTVATVAAAAGVTDGVIGRLVATGLARFVEIERQRDPFAEMGATTPPDSLSGPQRTAVETIAGLPPGDGALVFGVTGSGKTQVYLEAIRRGVEAGQGAIILVPEIGLTPQTVSRVRGVFGDQVAVLHSGLSDGERADAWRALWRGEKRVAVGPRSAVFAPVRSLGYLVIDEEHEASYKNGEAPRYHARDVAWVRCRLEGARLVLGSATPSLEAASQVSERLRLVRLPERIGSRPLPPVELVDLRTAPVVGGTGAVPWSERLDGALRQALAKGEQAIVLLNRRGYAAYLQCGRCGSVKACERCSISLTVHHHPAALRCHYCGATAPVSPLCESCGEPTARARGLGTQQVEQVVAERYPGARIARMDLDTTATKWSHHRILDRVAIGEIDILVGTQMIAKGIDFPNVTVVGVVDADTGLHLPDFRAAERTFQLITQVAGRAGRGPKGGRVLVQTRNPEHPALRFAARHDVEGFWETEREARRDPAYPPGLALVNIVVSGPVEPEVIRQASQLGDWLGALLADRRLALELLGPAPCPIAKVKDRFRWHLMLKGPGADLGRVVRYLADKLDPPSRVRVAIDRDPVSLL